MVQFRHFKCIRNVAEANILDFVVVSLYPTVNVLDEFAVGMHVNALVEDISQHRIIRLVKCEVISNRHLKRRDLVDNEKGKLLFHNNKMTGTWMTLELHKAVDMGYWIIEVHAATSYTSAKGLMNDYIMYFLRMHMCNNKPMNTEQRGEVNRNHKTIGFKDWKDIPPDDTSNTGVKTSG